MIHNVKRIGRMAINVMPDLEGRKHYFISTFT
jgi:hypothetical protein